MSWYERLQKAAGDFARLPLLPSRKNPRVRRRMSVDVAGLLGRVLSRADDDSAQIGLFAAPASGGGGSEPPATPDPKPETKKRWAEVGETVQLQEYVPVAGGGEVPVARVPDGWTVEIVEAENIEPGTRGYVRFYGRTFQPEGDLAGRKNDWPHFHSTDRIKVISNQVTAREVFWVPAERLADLKTKIGQLAKRAARLNLAPVTLDQTGETDMRKLRKQHDGDPDTFMKFVQVVVQGQRPKLKGWEFIGALQHLQDDNGQRVNMLRTLPGVEDVPAEFRTADPKCDHCKLNRRRASSFLVRHEDDETNVKQVGRQCLKDFTGHMSPENAAASAEYMLDLSDLKEQYGDEPEDGWSSAGPTVHQVVDVLTYAAAAIRDRGWISRKAADGMRFATADLVDEAMDPNSRGRTDRYTVEPTDEDRKLAEETVAWVAGNFGDKGDDKLSDYEWNLKVALTPTFLAERTLGIAVSAVAMYQRFLGHEIIRKKQAATSEWFGEKKKRSTYTFTLTARNSVDGHYGTTWIHSFLDEHGNVVKWFGSHPLEREDHYVMTDAEGNTVPDYFEHNPIEIGEDVKVKATIKDHKTYNGVKETHVTRVALVKGQERHFQEITDPVRLAAMEAAYKENGRTEFDDGARFVRGWAVEEIKKAPTLAGVATRRAELLKALIELEEDDLPNLPATGAGADAQVALCQARGAMLGELEAIEDAVTKAANAGYEKESERIRLRKAFGTVKYPHRFEAAEWTHPNGHPRCKHCGDEESTDGMCRELAKAAHAIQERRWIDGLAISIENAVGSYREWRDKDGETGRTRLRHAYGYVRGSLGIDGDHVDVFLGPLATTDKIKGTTVYAIQTESKPEFRELDEQKVMVGFRSLTEARAAFLGHYNDRRFLRQIDALSWADFKEQVPSTLHGGGMVRGVIVDRHMTKAVGRRLWFRKAHIKQFTRQGPSGPVEVKEHDDKRMGAQPKAPAAPRPPAAAPAPAARMMRFGASPGGAGAGAAPTPPPQPAANLATGMRPGAINQSIGPVAAGLGPAYYKALGEHIASYQPVKDACEAQLRQLFPGLPICGRLKGTQQLHDKLANKYEPQGKGMEAVEDIAGTRVHLEKVEDIKLAVARVKRAFTVRSEDDYISRPKGGYRSYHLIVEVQGKPVELQLRTKRMTVWADYAHDTVYKSHGQQAPPEATTYRAQMSQYFAARDEGREDVPPPECPEPVKTAIGCMDDPEQPHAPLGREEAAA